MDPGGAESYEYAEESEIKEVANVSDGDRLVGGGGHQHQVNTAFRRREVPLRKFPFMVGWNWYGFPDTMACTGERLLLIFSGSDWLFLLWEMISSI